jgi:hypothetical protein
LHGPAKVVERALRIVEDNAHALRQKLLARQLGRTVPSDHWQPAAQHEHGLSADDLRRHAAEARSRAQEK